MIIYTYMHAHSACAHFFRLCAKVSACTYGARRVPRAPGAARTGLAAAAGLCQAAWEISSPVRGPAAPDLYTCGRNNDRIHNGEGGGGSRSASEYCL